jgi:hypothetical protein
MSFRGTPRPGGFCLKTRATGCVEPFTVLTPARPSLSGAPPAVYCGIDEDATTCEAVLDLFDDKPCTSADDCGAPGLDDARCEDVSGVPGRCTYGCSRAAECPGTTACGPGPARDGGSSGRYCGG